jgi:hypothetical protein
VRALPTCGTGGGAGGDPAALVVAGIPASRSVALLEQDRQHMILMDAASRSLNMVGAPKLATRPAAGPVDGRVAGPVHVATRHSRPATVSAPPPDPGTAEAIAYNMLSVVRLEAEHLLRVPQQHLEPRERLALQRGERERRVRDPAGAARVQDGQAGPDWQTDPTTQIKWGLGYIQGRYGDPCSAWAFWEAHGWY